jgi:hypothetical protein
MKCLLPSHDGFVTFHANPSIIECYKLFPCFKIPVERASIQRIRFGGLNQSSPLNRGKVQTTNPILYMTD